MARLSARPIVLSKRQQRLLETERSCSKVACDAKVRIDIILLAAQGVSTNQIVRQLGSTYPTVQKWRNRWHEGQAALHTFEQGIDQAPGDAALLHQIYVLISDRARPGRPAQISLAQCQAIQVMACGKPADYELPFEEWTGELLARTAIKRGVIPSITGRYVNVLIKKKSFDHIK